MFIEPMIPYGPGGFINKSGLAFVPVQGINHILSSDSTQTSTITFYQCQRCHRLFVAHSGMQQHCCYSDDIKDFQFNPRKVLNDLIILAVVHDISIHALCSQETQNLIDDFGRDFHIPSEKTMRRRIIDKSLEIINTNIESLKGKTVSLLTDEAKRTGRYFEGVILYTKQRLYFYPFAVMKDNKAKEIATDIASVINYLNSKDISVISVCSDNGSTNIAAFNPKNPYAVEYHIGSGIIRVPCFCHLTETACKDVFYGEYKRITTAVIHILKYTPPTLKSTKQLSNTRWDSMYECVAFICMHSDFYSTYPATAQTFSYIDTEFSWSFLKQITYILWIHIASLERDHSSICDVMVYTYEVLKLLAMMQKPLAAAVYNSIINRLFKNDALCIPCAAFLLTYRGFEAIHNVLDPNLLQTIMKCAKKGVQIYSIERKCYDAVVTQNGFEWFLKENIDMSLYEENPEGMYEILMHDMKYTEEQRQFFHMAFEIVQIPCSEAAVERFFSCLEKFLSPQQRQTKNDLLNAKSIIKMEYLFSHSSTQNSSFGGVVSYIENLINEVNNHRHSQHV